MIYFVQAGVRGPVKIGKTNNLPARLSSLTIAHYETLSVLATLNLPDKVENRLHRLLKEHRIRGEWFRWCPEVQNVVELAKAGLVPEFPYNHRREELAVAAEKEAAAGAKRLASCLKRRGLTVVGAAKQIGIDRSILQRIVTGRRPASVTAMRRIIKWSGGEVEYRDFFEVEPPPSRQELGSRTSDAAWPEGRR